MRTFNINNKTYNAKPFDFNMICDLEDNGVSLEDFEKKPMGMARAYFSISSGLTLDEAGLEMQSHMISSNDGFEGLLNVIKDEIEESDFFLALNKTEEEETPKVQRKTTAKKTV